MFSVMFSLFFCLLFFVVFEMFYFYSVGWIYEITKSITVMFLYVNGRNNDAQRERENESE